MKTSKIIDIKNNMVTMSDGSQKFIDAYILELEDRLINALNIMEVYVDVKPWSTYKVSGEKLFELMDKLEGRK